MRHLTVISGGQTGADRGALEAAKALDIPTTGFCPHNYRTENGPDPTLRGFGILPTESRGYQERTERNVGQATAVVVFMEKRSAGSVLTIKLAQQRGKRLLVLDSDGPYTPQHLADAVKHFLATPPTVHRLMIAGNRESKAPEIQKRVTEILTLALS